MKYKSLFQCTETISTSASENDLNYLRENAENEKLWVQNFISLMFASPNNILI